MHRLHPGPGDSYDNPVEKMFFLVSRTWKPKQRMRSPTPWVDTWGAVAPSHGQGTLLGGEHRKLEVQCPDYLKEWWGRSFMCAGCLKNLNDSLRTLTTINTGLKSVSRNE